MDEAVKGLEAQAVIQARGEMPRPDDAARINHTTHAKNVATTIREEVKMSYITEKTASARCARSLRSTQKKLLELAGKWGADFPYIESTIEEAANAVERAAFSLEDADYV